MEVAHKELVQTAQYVIDSWITDYREFATVEKLEELYENSQQLGKY